MKITHTLISDEELNNLIAKRVTMDYIKEPGSGAIESAHRTIVQKRMKQSGQRWSNKGAQNMLN